MLPFKPIAIVIHRTESADTVAFDGNGVRRILLARKLGGYHAMQENIEGHFWTSMLNRFDQRAEHVAHHNSEYFGFAFIGSLTQPLSDERLRAAAADVASLLWMLRLPRTAIIRHSDVPDNNTDCPGKDFPWARFQELVRLA